MRSTLTLTWLLTATLAPVSYGMGEIVEFSGRMKCQGDCECSGMPDCPCSLSCPMATSSCAPGFTQVCQESEGNCPPGMGPLCSSSPPITTTTTTLPPPVTVSGEKKTGVKVNCGGVDFTCTLTTTYKDDCSKVTKVTPSCKPKKNVRKNRSHLIQRRVVVR